MSDSVKSEDINFRLSSQDIRVYMVLIFSVIVVSNCALRESTNIVRQFQDQSPEGSYEYGYETENGIYVQEEGSVRSIKDDSIDIVVMGSFLYKSPDGKEINLQYVADENGFQPLGEHLPTTPAIPLPILRALDWMAAHPEKRQ